MKKLSHVTRQDEPDEPTNDGAGLEHLKGVHTIDLYDCQQVTDAGLEHLKGAHTISLDYCPQVTNDYIMVLRQSGVIVIN